MGKWVPKQGLNKKQKAVLDIYFATRNGPGAYEEVYGCKSVTAPGQWSKLVNRADAQAYLAEKSQKLRLDSDLDEGYVGQRVKELIERCMQVQPVVDKNGAPTGQYKFDSTGAARGLDLACKLLGVGRNDPAAANANTTFNIVLPSKKKG